MSTATKSQVKTTVTVPVRSGRRNEKDWTAQFDQSFPNRKRQNCWTMARRKSSRPHDDTRRLETDGKATDPPKIAPITTQMTPAGKILSTKTDDTAGDASDVMKALFSTSLSQNVQSFLPDGGGQRLAINGRRNSRLSGPFSRKRWHNGLRANQSRNDRRRENRV